MLEIRDLTVRYGLIRAVDGLSAQLDAPICGLIGPNGAGKTTLVNALSGFLAGAVVSGQILLNDRDWLPLSKIARVRAGLRRSFQTEQVVEDLSVWDNVKALLDHLPGSDKAVQIERALMHTGLLTRWAAVAQDLNLFERRMLELAKTLVGNPKLILLDEPAAGLSDEETEQLRQTVSQIPALFGAHVLMIDHDVHLIASVCEQTLVLDFGRLLAVGATREVLDSEAVKRAYLGNSELAGVS